jgi:hypothetical protein
VSHRYDSLDFASEVAVFDINDTPPLDAEILGTVKVGDTGFSTNCGYATALDQAQLEARKIGGNAIQVTEHKLPSAFGSTCHRITAKILKLNNLQDYLARQHEADAPDSTWNYAKLYVYRGSGAGMLIAYNLMLNDSVICRVKSNSKSEVYITTPGTYRLSARTESSTELPIEIELGREYYIRCGLAMGILVGRPALEIAPRRDGRAEYNALKIK